jgi:hypothetical protein
MKNIKLTIADLTEFFIKTFFNKSENKIRSQLLFQFVFILKTKSINNEQIVKIKIIFKTYK